MSKLERWLWAGDFVISGFGWLLGGPYGAILCFGVAGVLIFTTLIRQDNKSESERRHPSIFVDETTTYARISKIKLWHKWGLGTFIICVICLISYGVFHWFHSPQSDIKIREIQIGTTDSEERLHVEETQWTIPDSPWAANVHYINQGSESHDVAIYLGGAFFDGMKTQDRDKINQMEDEEWDRFLVTTRAPNTTLQVAAQRPMFATINGASLNSTQLNNLLNYKAVYYFFALFTYKDGWRTPRSEMCVYREGNSPAVHQCHDHNNP